MQMTAEMIRPDAAPVWVSVLLMLAMWAAGLVLGYVGMRRLNHAQGTFLMLVRLVSLGWLWYAWRATLWIVQFGNLPNTIWTIVPLLVIAAGSAGMGVERMLMGRVVLAAATVPKETP